MSKEQKPNNSEAKPARTIDGLDNIAKILNNEKWIHTGIVLAAPAIALSLSTIHEPIHISIYTSTLPVAGALFINVFRYIHLNKIEKKYKQNSYLNPDYLFRLDQLNYRGDKTISWNSGELKKNQRIKYIYMPRLNIAPDAQPIPGSLVQEYTQLVLPELLESTDIFPNRKIVIDSHLPFWVNGGTELTRGEILARNGIKIGNVNKSVRLISRGELAWECAPHKVNLFDTGLEFLHDEWLRQWRQEVVNCQNTQELERVSTLMYNRLKSIIHTELTSIYGESGILREGKRHERRKRKVSWNVRLIETPESLDMVRESTSGEIEHNTVSNKIHLKDRATIDTIIQENSIFTKAQVCHELLHMLREHILEEIIKVDRQRTYAEIIADFKELGYTFEASNPSLYRFVELHPFRLKFLKRAAATILGASVLTGVGSYEAYKLLGLNNLNSISPINSEGQAYEVGFMDELPQAGLVWNLQGNMSPAGLYITATSHKLENGRWIVDEDEFEVKAYPQITFNDLQGHFLLLSQEAMLGGGPTEIALPLRPDLRLQAITITDSNNEPIEHEVLEFPDGTVRLRILGTIWNSTASAMVQVLFVPSDSASITATEYLEPLSPELLSSEVVKLIQTLNLENPDMQNPLAIAAYLANTREYQLTLPGGAQIDYSTRESILNSLTEIQVCNCEICATQVALLSTLFPELEEPVNMAFGYVVGGSSDQTISNTYLRNEALHAVALGGDGVVYDATPGRQANDELTQAYLRMLQIPAFAGTDGVVWENQIQNIRDYAEKRRQEEIMARVLEGAFAVGIVGFAGWYIGKNRKRFISKESFISASDEVFSALFGEQDRTDAFQFLSWVSWGTTDFPAIINRAENEGITFGEMSSRLDYDKLQDYHDNPRAYGGSKTTQMLASYLLFRNKFK